MFRPAFLFALGASALIWASCATPASIGTASRTTAIVERVIDGDTLVVRAGQRVRLVQIDSPEARNECYAEAATRELARLARPGLRVVLEQDPRLDGVDRYGRLLRYVHTPRANVNVELVRRGAAAPWFYGGERGRYAGKLLAAVGEARDGRRGMWSACRVTWTTDGPVETRRR